MYKSGSSGFLSNNFHIKEVRTIKIISLCQPVGANKSESLWKYDLINRCLFFPIGNPPATGTGTLHITLEDVNDNVPSLYPTLAKVCDDAKDLRVVVLGASDKDLHPNTDPFKFELSRQSGPEKLWRINRLNSKAVTLISVYLFLPLLHPSVLPLRQCGNSGAVLLENLVGWTHCCCFTCAGSAGTSCQWNTPVLKPETPSFS